MISQKKPSKHIPKIDTKQQIQPLRGKIKRMFATFLSAFLAFIAIATAYYTFAFKISIIPSGSLNPSDPFATPFVLQNDSLLWINLIKYKCLLRKIETADYLIIENIVTSASKVPPIAYLTSAEKTTIILPFRNAITLRAPIIYADV